MLGTRVTAVTHSLSSGRHVKYIKEHARSELQN